MEHEWFCPAIKKVIAHGLCWEYFFAVRGGPTDRQEELREWIRRPGTYKDLDEFQDVCETSKYKHG